MKRSKTTGARKIQRLFKKLEPEISEELFETIKGSGDILLKEQRKEVPRRSGRLRGALQVTTQRKSLRANVGLVTKAARKKAPYGHIVVRGTRGGNGRAARPANDFIRRAQFQKAKEILGRNREALNKALRRVARGNF